MPSPSTPWPTVGQTEHPRSRSPPRPAAWPETERDRESQRERAREDGLERIFAMMEDKKLRLVDLFHSLDRDRSGTIDAAELGG